MKTKTVFYCTECGNETVKWYGKCPACGCYNTMVEQPVPEKINSRSSEKKSNIPFPQQLSDLKPSQEIRFDTGLNELNRVLGGGAVKGSLNLVGGAPGIGKSTLLLQICESLGKKSKILYVSGEESLYQLKLRADRLKVTSKELYILAETDLSAILEATASFQPDILIIDSIQTLVDETLTSAPGSVGQVKECTMSLMKIAKQQGITIFVIGHVNKEGAIAGPKVLEHMVDCVLYFEGTGSSSYRILRAAKNRFGSTNEIGVFEMLDCGLVEIENPSETLLSGRPENAPGTCVSCVMEGSRPILAEIQALLTPTGFNVPRRTSNGVDYNRAMLLLAVLEKRGGLRIGGCDAYINVIGGLSLTEPAADLATILAIASSYRDCPIADDIVAIGEIGLTGEIRSVSHMNQRLSEIARLGFKKCIMPEQSTTNLVIPANLQIEKVKTIRNALNIVLK